MQLHRELWFAINKSRDRYLFPMISQFTRLAPDTYCEVPTPSSMVFNTNTLISCVADSGSGGPLFVVSVKAYTNNLTYAV